jgi:phage gpG-like protein
MTETRCPSRHRDHAAGCRLVFCVALLAPAAFGAGTAVRADKVNEANDPLTAKLTLSLQDQYVGSYKELSPDSNANEVRLTATIPHRFFDLPLILRAALPIVTTPDHPLPSTTGLGDLIVSDLLVLKWYEQEFAIGPMFTFPTATEQATGTGKWQVGAAAASIETERWGLFGALVTYQHSFAGDSGRPRQSVLQAQPFITVNLPAAFYLRTTAIWTFDLEQETDFIPVGIGVGRVWLLARGTTLNTYVEPQYTVARQGVVPAWQIFAGVNCQFPSGPR